ncbi:restriction endonuclease subunit S [Neorhizobium tomejilense]|uniref:restriction endonuclease subunit S n=1 Tax=Neorhizobium tomejilense TaxID=2093828 RepID=UPI003ECDB889
MSFPAYPTYRDSGVEWLGEVPTHWSVHRISELYREVVQPGHDELPILSVSIHDGVSDGEAEPDDGGRKVNRSDDRSKYKQVRPNDLVYNMMRAWQGGFGSVKVLGMVSPAYVVARPRHDAPSGLIELMLRTTGAIEEMRRRSKGVTDFRLRLYWDEFKDMRIALPPLREQLEIINFLSRETAKIDALVEEQRRLITLLKEKRQAVISHAVSKGLIPDTPTKNSGTDWFGEIPRHWQVAGIKHYCHRVTDGAHISPEIDDGVHPFISTKDLIEGDIDFENCLLTSEDSFAYLVQTGCQPSRGDVLFSKDGTVGRTVVVETERSFVVASSLIIISPSHDQLDARYLHYLCQSSSIRGQVESFVKGAGLPRLSIQNLLRVIGVFPPISEQKIIASYLDSATDRFDLLISEASSAISLLAERRAGLISAAVTGKINVRNTSKALSFPVNRAYTRGLIASEIIERSAHQATFGRVKLQKIAYLAEAHVGVTELEGAYLREAAGPLDREMIREMEREAGALGGVKIEQPDGTGSAVTYRLAGHRGAHRQDLHGLLGDRCAKFDKLVEDIGTIDTKGAEAVATLFAVWNDALIDGETPADMEIKLAVLSNWHPEKARKFNVNELQIWLDWMRRHDLVPRGTGPKTTTGRLFA